LAQYQLFVRYLIGVSLFIGTKYLSETTEKQPDFQWFLPVPMSRIIKNVAVCIAAMAMGVVARFAAVMQLSPFDSPDWIFRFYP
jgi:ABC-type enterochelin transport system permease subunit